MFVCGHTALSKCCFLLKIVSVIKTVQELNIPMKNCLHLTSVNIRPSIAMSQHSCHWGWLWCWVWQVPFFWETKLSFFTCNCVWLPGAPEGPEFSFCWGRTRNSCQMTCTGTLKSVTFYSLNKSWDFAFLSLPSLTDFPQEALFACPCNASVLNLSLGVLADLSRGSRNVIFLNREPRSL